MMNYIQLDRQFSLLPRNKTDEYFEYQSESIYSDKLQWDSLLLEYRTVILAEAGAGKTTEFIQQAIKLEAEGKRSFFIRIEDIDKDFIESFEVGNEDFFDEWLQSKDEAWFFLDSVDEARLESPRQFDKAIRKFARQIKSAVHRCHIYISSRPYSWRFEKDESLLNTEIFLASKHSSEDKKINSSLKVYTLCPLNTSQIEQFCSVRSLENTESFLSEIQIYNLMSLAERPFDLENMIAKWKDDKKLGSRTEVIQHNIHSCLLDKHNEDRTTQVELSRDKLEEGAQRIASIVTLTGKVNIRVPNSPRNNECIDASELLPEWNKNDINYLVNSAIFNDVVYDAVRFRHREIREFLTAQWFKKILNSDNRLGIEALFIREQFREQIITPLLRPILPWLIPYDEKLKSKILQIQPEIAFEGGDFFQLSLSDRGKFLESLVNKIASSQGHRGMMHNEDIARIASQDLENHTDELIQQYFSNKDVIFFLARLAWKGNMVKCLPSLLPIALDITNDVHTRAVCIRTIICCGQRANQIDLWQSLNNKSGALDLQIIAELVDHIEPDAETIQLLLNSLKSANKPEEYEATGIMQALEKFSNKCDEDLLFEFLNGLAALLFTAPFYEEEYCKISEKYSWLVKISLQIVIRLIQMNSRHVFNQKIIEMLISIGALVYKQDIVESFEFSFSDENQKLKQLITQLNELNDGLYWQTVKIARDYHGKLDDNWVIHHSNDLWEFKADSFERLIGYVQTKQLMDDKFLAFNRSFQIYSQNDKPEWMLQQLKDISTEYPMLEERLNLWLNPPPREKNDEDLELEEKHEIIKREIAEKYQQEKLAREEWIKSLKENPDQITISHNSIEGNLTNNHIWLMDECKVNPDVHTSWGTRYINWKALRIEFGEQVAHKYYDEITQFWRIYKPKLNSEENIEKGRIPYELVFSLTGLEIEARENQNFPSNFNIAEVENALRYITWEMNGFPTWFEKMYQAFPEATIKAVLKELIWSLDNSEDIILSDLVYTARWLHVDIASAILNYLLTNQIILIEKLQAYVLEILLNGEITSEQFVTLAYKMLGQSEGKDQALWYALLVDSDPNAGISLLKTWLLGLSEEDATHAAQVFITHLINQRGIEQVAINGRAGKGIIKTAKYLKQLYIIVHQYIKIEDDINRSDGGVYSPTLRDHAQRSRDSIFQKLSEMVNSESYHAIKELVNQESNQSRAIWMNQIAYRIAVSCGNLKKMSIDQVLDLEKSGIIHSKTHKELFALALLKINALKDWLENGDTSPFLTWQKAKIENEMRVLIAGQLSKESQGKYTISQEDEKANGQRTDIRFDKPNITSVPVELKILDKNWKGKDLCERLRNQLIGDYLREENAGCGIFLLVAQNIIEKTWEINGKQVILSELENVLQEYWHSIAHEWPKIDSIKVIVIDLNKRSLVSKT